MVRKLLTKMMAVAAGVIAVSSVGSMAFANNHYDTEAQLYLDEASGISEADTKKMIHMATLNIYGQQIKEIMQ